MITMANLRHGTMGPLGGARAAVTYLSDPAQDGKPLEVELGVSMDTGEEIDYTLHLGDVFPVGDATWRLAAVDGAGTWEYVVRLVRVDGPTAP